MSIARSEAGGALGDVGAERFGGCVGQGDVALLLPFAADEDGLIGPLNVIEIEGRGLGVADAAAVEHFQDGLVASGPACGVVKHRVDRAVELLDGGHARQMLGQARRGDEGRGVLLDVVIAGQPLEPTADGGEGAGGGGLGESAIVERGEVRTDVGVLDAGDGEAGMRAGEPRGEAMQFAAVGAEGVGR